MALKIADVDGFEKRKAESKKRGKLRGLGMSNTIERAAAPASRAPKSASTAAARCRSSPARINQGQGHETTFKQVVADQLGVHPDDIEYIQGDTDKVFFGEGTGGSRSATMSGSAFYQRRREGHRQGQGDRRAQPQGRCRRRQVRRRHLLQRQDQPDPDHQGRRAGRVQSGEAAEGHGGRACTPPQSTRPTSRISRTASTSARSRSTPRPARSRSCATTWSTTSAP